jgi:hypothetical protein
VLARATQERKRADESQAMNKPFALGATNCRLRHFLSAAVMPNTKNHSIRSASGM